MTAQLDKFEGSVPRALSMTNVASKLGMEGDAQSLIALLHQHLIRGRRFVNCWHLSEGESDAMWKLYSSSGESVCLETTYGQLQQQVPESEYSRIGLVNYLDYDRVTTPQGQGSFDPAFLKKDAFSHEKEVRISITELHTEEAKSNFFNELLSPNRSGISLKVDLNLLINQVRVNPLAPDWFLELVKYSTRKFGYHFDIEKSELSSDPIY